MAFLAFLWFSLPFHPVSFCIFYLPGCNVTESSLNLRLTNPYLWTWQKTRALPNLRASPHLLHPNKNGRYAPPAGKICHSTSPTIPCSSVLIPLCVSTANVTHIHDAMWFTQVDHVTRSTFPWITFLSISHSVCFPHCHSLFQKQQWMLIQEHNTTCVNHIKCNFCGMLFLEQSFKVWI